MEYWLTWVIVLGIGLLVGFIVHAIIRYAQGSSILVTLLAGIIGAFIAAYYIAPEVTLYAGSRLAERFTWAVIGSLILSLIVELLFAGSRRGRVVAT